MADRTSARLFKEVFDMLASIKKADKPVDVDELAVKFWNIKEEGGYDFNDYQMYADESLKALGLMREGTEKDEWGEIPVFYGPADDID